MKTHIFTSKPVQGPRYSASNAQIINLKSIQTFAKRDKNAAFHNTTAEVIEIAALGVAVASQASFILSQKQELTNNGAPGLSSKKIATATTPTGIDVPRTPFIPNINPLWITSSLLIAAIARRLAAQSTKKLLGTNPSTQALTRLLAIESTVDHHSQTLQHLSKNVDKLQTRTRLLSRDVTSTLKSLQERVGEHEGILIGTTTQIESLHSDVREVEGLVGAVQQVVAKQVTLLTGVVGGSGKKKNEKKTNKVVTNSVLNKKKEVHGETKNTGIAAEQKKSEEVDEWGRNIVFSSSSSSSRVVNEDEDSEEEGLGEGDDVRMQKNNDGTVSYTFTS